ncbi:SOS response-associated peptidase [Kiritimatiellota bacterium B12222]|nr:SOS response-associated peptidase [Kiritimatiellota bacterium B12222]
MCGRFSLAKKAKKLKKDFPDFPVDPRMEPRYNISPTQPVTGWVADPSPRMEIFSWGLIPPWAKDPAFGAKCINARAETLMQKPSFKTPYRRKRCLIPADGWYEWKRGTQDPKLPVRFRRRDDACFVFAGLWEEWHDKEGGMILSCSIITTRPNALTRKIHPRMPAVLRDEDWFPWLDPNSALKDLDRMLLPVAADEFTYDEVSPEMNRSGVESPHFIEPWQESPKETQGELF